MPSAKTSPRSSASGFPDPQLLTVQDLSGGIDLRTSPSLMKPNRARRLRNWSLQEPGALVRYPGWRTFSTSSLGAGRPQGGARVYLAAHTFTLAAFNGAVYKPTDAGVWGSSVVSSLDTANAIFFPYDRDIVAILDGTHVPKKSTTGATWTQLGIDAPAAAPTAGAVAGGSLIVGNTYEFSYSGQDDELTYEGNESATVRQATAGANLRIQLTLPKHPDAQVDTLVVYARDVTAGETVRRKTGTVANPAGASVTYDVTANNWSLNNEAPTDHNVPPALDFGVIWKNRWWARDAAVKNRLRFTQLFTGQAWPTLFYIDIPFERGDSIAAVVPSGDTLVIFGYATKPYLVIGQTSLDFEVRPSAQAEVGALGPRATATVENGIIHAAAEGVYIFDGATDRLLSYDIDPGWQDFVTLTSASNLERIACVYHRTRKEVRVAVPRLYPYAVAGEWVLDLNRTRLQETAAWTTTDRALGGYVPWDGREGSTGDRGRLFAWSDTIGLLSEEATGTTADGAAMTADYEGPAFITDLLMARFLELYGAYEPNAGSLALEVLIDGVSVASFTENVGAGLAVYSTGLYGTAVYAGAGRKTFVKTLPLTAEGRSFVLRATYTGSALLRWFSYALSVLAETLPRGL
jgi:hypothetical protein